VGIVNTHHFSIVSDADIKGTALGISKSTDFFEEIVPPSLFVFYRLSFHIADALYLVCKGSKNIWITQISLIFCGNFIEKLASFGARNVVKVENGTAKEPSCVKRSEQTRSSIFKTSI
jgi:hypothetical protein